MPLVWPVFGFVIAQTGSLIQRLTMEAQAKNRIKSIFSAYVAPEVVHQLVESGEDPKLGGEETEITAFFSDIQGFSTFSEQLSPTELVALMNEYLSEMSHILKYAGSGTLDKFIGDAMVGIFGAPYHYPDHAYRSCVTAIEMHRRQGELRDAWKASGQWPDLVHQMRTRIGLNTGLAIVGNMGSRDRMNYTMMGDTVNLAARCESGAKSYGVYTMVTGETKAAAEQAKDDMVFRFLDRIIVKGRSQPVEVYDLLGFQHDLPSQTRECVASFEQGIAHYLDQDWDQALIHFEHAAEHEPHQPNNQGLATNPSLVLAERCRRLKETPPSKDWDGVYVMTSK
ncbi:MAG: adenylate/guanylate cyclase domain-containing protein [Verrucomicrobiota bacterium]